MTAPLRAKKSNNTIVWALLGLLIISLTGFGVQSVGNGGSQTVASVGDEEVSVNTYVRALNARLQQFSQQVGQNVSLEQGLAFGVDRQVMQQILATAALDGENTRIGLSVGDARVRDSLLATEAFQNITGQFDETAYNFALDQANLKPGEYDEVIRGDASRSMLQTAVIAGIQANDSFGLALLNYIGEGRDFKWVTLTPDLLVDANRAPSTAEVEAHYKANPEAYTAPEARQITYTLLTPDMLLDKIAGDEAALRAIYDDQPERFNIPARRIADRLVFGSVKEAQAALDAITAGTSSFEDAVLARGLSLEDVDLGEVTKADLANEASEAVFLLAQPGMVGPVQSSLGPALFRVNAILEAQITSFDEARDALHTEYVADRARRLIEDDITRIDDLLAGGAVLEEIAAETDMELGKIAFSIGDTDGIAAHEEFREIAASITQDDFPSVHNLEDGGIFALRLDEITPPRLKPLTEVVDQVTADWNQTETRRRLMEMATRIRADLADGDTYEALALTPTSEANIRRENFIDGAPASLVAEVFKLTEGEIAIVENGDTDSPTVVLASLTAIQPFDEKAPENATMLTGVGAQYSQQIGSDILAAYIQALQNEAGISLNQALINAVHRQIP